MKKVINLSGRIDSSNANVVEENINKDLQNFNGELILDASNLEYISSAGLRIILKLKKSNDMTEIINCSPEIYEIFNMTGFTEIMDISKSFREISIDGSEVIGDGFYGIVYRIDPETIVKVYKVPDSLEMIKREKKLARKAFVMGIPTAIPYDIVKVGNLYGSVFELLNAKSIASLINDDSYLDEFVKKSVGLLKTIHSTHVNPNELPSRRNQEIVLAQECEKWLQPDVYKKLIVLLENIPETYTMLHSDFHIKNIMQQDNELLLIDMDTLSTGHPIFEFGGMYATYYGFSCINKNNTQEFLGISFDTSKKIWDSTFKMYYNDKSKAELDKIQEKIAIISYLQILFLKTKFIEPDNEVQKKEIEFCQNYLNENVPKLDTLSY